MSRYVKFTLEWAGVPTRGVMRWVSSVNRLSLCCVLDYYVILLVVGTYHVIPLLSTTTYTPLEKNSGVLATEAKTKT